MRTFFIRSTKRKGSASGFTLVELVFVLAIITILAVTILPVAFDLIRKAEVAMADRALQTLYKAVKSFKADLNIWPASDGTQKNNQVLKLLFACAEVASCEGRYPDSGTTDWSLTVDDDGSPVKNNQLFHLSRNDPNANDSEDSNDYSRSGKHQWGGPYLFGLVNDPWGNAFVINIGAFPGVGTNTGKCWLLSAGPDGILQTSKGDSELSGDDVGWPVC